MEIKKKIFKEVDEVCGYKCDICNNDIDVGLFPNINLSYVKYTMLLGGWGERSEMVIKHICSCNCLKKVLQQSSFDIDMHLSLEMVEELARNI